MRMHFHDFKHISWYTLHKDNILQGIPFADNFPNFGFKDKGNDTYLSWQVKLSPSGGDLTQLTSWARFPMIEIDKTRHVRFDL